MSWLLAPVLALFVLQDEPEWKEGFADSDGVKIHYVELGEGPLVVLIHGFPDYWYSWRHQMPALAEHHHVVAIDQRGYNKSGQPEGVEAYAMERLVSDVEAVIDHHGAEQATVVGHDWGGFVAWNFAMSRPEFTERLIILNLPHPTCLQRELATNENQRRNSQYARNFQKPEAGRFMRASMLGGWVKDPAAQKKYAEALGRSSIEGMLNYYKANYPREPYELPEAAPPMVQCDVLQIHGMKDTYLLAGALDGTWKYVQGEWTLLTIPEAGHFVQHEAAERVTAAMLEWLARD